MMHESMRYISWIIPFYRNVPMLRLHLTNLGTFPKDVRDHVTVFLVDDCSPEDERPDELVWAAPSEVRSQIRLLRILDDIPWNQHGARNLGAKIAKTPWLLQTDMDRIVPAHDMRQILTRKLNLDRYYKPLQYIARPDGMPIAELVERAPYNQFLVGREAFWKAGGYDEDYCGCYGGDTPLLAAFKRRLKFERMRDVRMLRFTRHVLEGANTADLDREAGRAEYARRFRDKHRTGRIEAVRPIRFRWTEVKL